MRASMLDPTLYKIKTANMDDHDKFVAENGVDARLTCLGQQLIMMKASKKKTKRDSDDSSSSDGDKEESDEDDSGKKITKDPMVEFVEKVFK